jgi:hypothetical protein
VGKIELKSNLREAYASKVTRRFFDQVDDEVRALLGPTLRAFHSQRDGRLVKIWYGDPAIHFEAQRLSRRWSPEQATSAWIEVGLHMETPVPEENDEMLRRVESRRHLWEGSLGAAEGGACYGPRGRDWRRLSELMEVEDSDDPDSASEVAELLAAYVRTLKPLVDKLQRSRLEPS